MEKELGDDVVIVDQNDVSYVLKPDHETRPLWVSPDRHVFLETFSPIYKEAYDFLIAIAEPVSRPELIHEYQLTPHSLHAAASIGLETGHIIDNLNMLSKNEIPDDIRRFVENETKRYGKVRIVLNKGRYFIESHDRSILEKVGEDPDIMNFWVSFEIQTRFVDKTSTEVRIAGTTSAREPNDASKSKLKDLHTSARHPKEIYYFEIIPAAVERVKARALEKGYPMLEEYDFRNDFGTETLSIDLKPATTIRPYQEKSLSKMFGNSRARSGIIVLPCGSGKTLVGITAICTIRKSVLILCTSGVAVEQWRNQLKLWTNVQDSHISRFTSATREITRPATITISTYSMISYTQKRSEVSEAVMAEISSKEWGLMILDEVHVVPAQVFRQVISSVKAHCKLGLTATLVREDQLISDLHYLIGPKLYEANWMDLKNDGHIANVQCAEVWCPMTAPFYREYLVASSGRKKLLYAMNPVKFRICELLVRYHENRGDKVLVFSDNLFALRRYATTLERPFIYGGTGQAERMHYLSAFMTNTDTNTLFISKVGDNSIDLPEANVLIQISSLYGSRRQEAQRLGRILRPKAQARVVHIPGNDQEQFNAYFYTLVSQDTEETYFSNKRQRFLVDQGYAFTVITSLADMAASSGDLHFGSPHEQDGLLQEVLAAHEDAADNEKIEVVDDIQEQKEDAKTVKRSMGAVSGGDDMLYDEVKRTKFTSFSQTLRTAANVYKRHLD